MIGHLIRFRDYQEERRLPLLVRQSLNDFVNNWILFQALADSRSSLLLLEWFAAMAYTCFFLPWRNQDLVLTFTFAVHIAMFTRHIVVQHDALQSIQDNIVSFRQYTTMHIRNSVIRAGYHSTKDTITPFSRKPWPHISYEEWVIRLNNEPPKMAIFISLILGTCAPQLSLARCFPAQYHDMRNKLHSRDYCMVCSRTRCRRNCAEVGWEGLLLLPTFRPGHGRTARLCRSFRRIICFLVQDDSSVRGSLQRPVSEFLLNLLVVTALAKLVDARVINFVRESLVQVDEENYVVTQRGEAVECGHFDREGELEERMMLVFIL